MGIVVFNPQAMRDGANKLVSLAAVLRSDPGAQASVVADVAAQLRELAGEKTSRSQAALADAADSFEASANITPEAIEEFANRLAQVADNQAATIESTNRMFTNLF